MPVRARSRALRPGAPCRPKRRAAPTDARHRVAMLALAIEGRPDWSLFSHGARPGRTLLHRRHAARAIGPRLLHDELWLLMGTDALAGLARWKEPAEIVRLARVAAFYRDPFAKAALVVPDVPGLAQRLEVFDAGSVRISATELRKIWRGGQAPRGASRCRSGVHHEAGSLQSRSGAALKAPLRPGQGSRRSLRRAR